MMRYVDPTPLKIEPVTLEGRYIRLEPLSMAHVDPLWEAASDPSIWQWTTASITSLEDMRKYIEIALTWLSEGRALPFVTVDKASGRAIGSTRFGNIQKDHRCVELGWTWINPKWQRTPVNTEAKYLQLRHAFEVLGCIRVELKTDVFNERSQQAIRRLGAKQEGIFRNHMIIRGRVRDSMYFSIIDTDWPETKARLEEMLARPYSPK